MFFLRCCANNSRVLEYILISTCCEFPISSINGCIVARIGGGWWNNQWEEFFKVPGRTPDDAAKFLRKLLQKVGLTDVKYEEFLRR